MTFSCAPKCDHYAIAVVMVVCAQYRVQHICLTYKCYCTMCGGPSLWAQKTRAQLNTCPEADTEPGMRSPHPQRCFRRLVVVSVSWSLLFVITVFGFASVEI